MSTLPPIQSPQNSRVQLVRALMNQGKARLKQQAFVAEGVRLVADGLHSDTSIKFILHNQNPSALALPLIDEASQGGVDINSVEDRLFDSLSGTENSQGVLAVFEMKPFEFPAEANFVIAPDQLRDPGNMGTILRSAEAAGAQAVLLPPGNTDVFAPKVVRSGMGAHFRLPIQHLPWEVIADLLQAPMPVCWWPPVVDFC